MSRIGTTFLITLGCAIGFWIPDIISHRFDRADIAVPMIAAVASYITQWVKEM